LADENEHGKFASRIKSALDATKVKAKEFSDEAEWVLGRRTARVLGLVALFVVALFTFLLVLPLVLPLKVLNSNYVLLVMGFILTTIAGALISTWLQTQTWNRQTRVDLYRKRHEEGSQFLDELGKLIGNRFFQLQRYFWAIKDMQNEDMQDDKLRAVEAEYFDTVAEWNSVLRLNRSKIRLLVGDTQALLFLDYGDDARGDNPRSIHYLFVKAHEAVDGVKKGEVDTYSARAKISRLNKAISGYLDALTTDFLKRAADLQLLKTPEESTK
jgi:hypothetical protein